MEAIIIGVCVAVAALLVVWTLAKLALPLSILVERWLSEVEKDRYFNIMYRPKYGTEFCRAHLVGKAGKLEYKALYLIEIHPKDADKAYAWTVPEEKLFEGHLLEEGKFYIVAFKEELYD